MGGAKRGRNYRDGMRQGRGARPDVDLSQVLGRELSDGTWVNMAGATESMQIAKTGRTEKPRHKRLTTNINRPSTLVIGRRCNS
eukprot:scaffold83052_cov37-Tisochrysis_lutea.AAC.5